MFAQCSEETEDVARFFQQPTKLVLSLQSSAESLCQRNQRHLPYNSVDLKVLRVLEDIVGWIKRTVRVVEKLGASFDRLNEKVFSPRVEPFLLIHAALTVVK